MTINELIIEKQIELIGKLQLNKSYPAEEISNTLFYYDGIPQQGSECSFMRYADVMQNFHIFFGNKELKYLGREK